MRLQLEIDELDEPAYPLATLKFRPLFYERHRVAGGTDTTSTTTVGLRYTRGLCNTEFRVVRGEPAFGQGAGTSGQH